MRAPRGPKSKVAGSTAKLGQTSQRAHVNRQCPSASLEVSARGTPRIGPKVPISAGRWISRRPWTKRQPADPTSGAPRSRLLAERVPGGQDRRRGNTFWCALVRSIYLPGPHGGERGRRAANDGKDQGHPPTHPGPRRAGGGGEQRQKAMFSMMDILSGARPLMLDVRQIGSGPYLGIEIYVGEDKLATVALNREAGDTHELLGEQLAKLYGPIDGNPN